MECKAMCGNKLGSDLSEILEKRQARSELSEEQAESILQQTQDTIDHSRMLSRKEVKEYKKLFSRYVLLYVTISGTTKIEVLVTKFPIWETHFRRKISSGLVLPNNITTASRLPVIIMARRLKWL